MDDERPESIVMTEVAGIASRPGPPDRGPRRVPEVTAYFWIIKVLTTAMGEATSDYLVHRFDPVVAVGFGAVGLAGALILQFSMRRYVAGAYWFAVVMVAVFGTMVADVLHIKFGIPYQLSAGLFAVVLAVVFIAWQRTERTLSIHSIYTTQRELFYWAAVISTFALGTAVGDMTATTLHLGYFFSGVLFAALIAVPALAFRFLGLNAILAFWSAYVLTRPLGASFADWMGKPHAVGGLALGDGRVSFGLTVVIVGLVGYLTVTRRDARADDTPRSA
jgi:uncharacterized membrane-anchored protein